MTTSQDNLPVFEQAGGEVRTLNLDYGPLMAADEFLTGSPTAAISTTIGNTAAIISQLARESGDEARQVSLLVATPAARHQYKLRVSCATTSGQTLILQAIVKATP